MPISFTHIELVEWRSGQVVFLPLSQPESTGSILGIAEFLAMRGPSNPRTTRISKKTQWFLLSLSSNTAARGVSVLFEKVLV